MIWADTEKAFNRAMFSSFSWRKIAFAFPALLICGILIVFCRAVAFDASDWISMSLLFLPLLLSSAILLPLGTLLVKIHHHETKKLSLDLRRIALGSYDLILGMASLAIPSVLAYLCLWIVLGVFFLLKEIPFIGEFFSVVFSFAPFLLILGSLALCLYNLGLLFFAVPAASYHSFKPVSIAKRILETMKVKLFSCLTLFFIGLLPLAFSFGILTLAASLTNGNFSMAERSLTVALEWFFIMVPFAALLTPSVIFFFTFSAECYQLLQPSFSLPFNKVAPAPKVTP